MHARAGMQFLCWVLVSAYSVAALETCGAEERSDSGGANLLQTSSGVAQRVSFGSNDSAAAAGQPAHLNCLPCEYRTDWQQYIYAYKYCCEGWGCTCIASWKGSQCPVPDWNGFIYNGGYAKAMGRNFNDDYKRWKKCEAPYTATGSCPFRFGYNDFEDWKQAHGITPNQHNYIQDATAPCRKQCEQARATGCNPTPTPAPAPAPPAEHAQCDAPGGCVDGEWSNSHGHTCADLRAHSGGGAADWTDTIGRSAGKACCQFCPKQKCCWNRLIQSCSSSSDCDHGGEGCIDSGATTAQYGVVTCNTCEMQGKSYQNYHCV